MLSYEEIFELTKICLSKFMTGNEEDGFLDMLCEFFTCLIFEAVGIDIEDEIPLKTIKNTIVKGGKESELLSMFCGADIWNLLFSF